MAPRSRFFSNAPPGFFDDPSTDSGVDEAGPNFRASMNSFGAQPGARAGQRLRNSNQSGLGNGNAGAGWAFGAPSANAFGGLGGAPGLGQPRPGPQLSGFAQVMGGGGAQGPIDMSDFPSLSGAPRAQHPTSSWNSNVIRQQPIQQQSAAPQPQSQAGHQQQQVQPTQRAPSAAPSHQSLEQQLDASSRNQQSAADRAGGSGDDFPPLSVQPNGEPMRQANGFGSALTSPDDAQPPTNGQQTQLPMRGASSVFSPNSQAPIGTSQAGAQSQTPSRPLPPPESDKPYVQSLSSSKAWADMTPAEKWGMPGLVKRFETLKNMETGAPIDPTLPPQERNIGVLMGQDLSGLDMDLDSSDPLHKTFHPFPDANSRGTIFDDRARRVVPEFTVPQAYYVSNVPPMDSRMSAFSDETLFAIFFQSTGDIKQEYAAAELARRDWRWHRDIRHWLQHDTREANAQTSLNIIDQTNGMPIGIEPTRLADGKTEQGVYIFFDHLNWNRVRRNYTLNTNELDIRGLEAREPVPHNSAAAQAAMPAGATVPTGNYPGVGRQNSIISAGPDP